MKRKRRWIQEYRCYKYGMNILKKIFFCKEPFEKCEGCHFLTKCQFDTDAVLDLGVSNENNSKK